MNRLLKFSLLVTVLLLAIVPVVMAQTGDTITDTVVAGDDFQTLEAAVVAAGLADTLATGEWTVFAPNDLAFAKLGLTPDNIASEFSQEELADLLLYHVLPGVNATADLKTMLGNVTMANGQQAGLKFYEDDIYVNDDSKVIVPDIVVQNGRIHVVDSVILPPWPREAEMAPTAAEAVEAAGGELAEAVTAPEAPAPAEVVVEEPAEMEDMAMEAAEPAIPDDSIAGIAIADGRFDTLVSAVVATGLVDELSGGEWTVFAPTDEAFAKLGLNAANIANEFSTDELRDLLLYHVLEGNMSTAELKTMLGNVTMANGQLAGLKFYEDHIYVNDDSMVTIPNIVAENGTVHVVDNVILPPWPRE